MDVLDRIHECAKNKGPAGLPRMRTLLGLLGNPEEKLRVFHVGGTNGKGSTSCFIKAMLEAEGYEVGMFTSPHVEKYNERFQIGDELISDEDFERLANEVMSHNEELNARGHGKLSLFEILTGIAYLFFSEKSPDYVIMEVGIGGRIDVTNTIVSPVACVITQVGLDHTEILGESLEEIAYEKSGIIKDSVPIISESPEPEVKNVIRKVAAEKGATFIDTSEASYEIRGISLGENDFCGMRFDLRLMGKSYKDLEISMFGEHQIRNAIAAVAAVIEGASLSEKAIRLGLKKGFNPGRFEFLRKEKPQLIIDGAHNEAGIKAAIESYERIFSGRVKQERLLVSFGCLNDKDYAKMVMLLASAFPNANFCTLEADSYRSVPCEELEKEFLDRSCKCTSSKSPDVILGPELGEDYDVILALGSIYLIGEIKTLFNERK